MRRAFLGLVVLGLGVANPVWARTPEIAADLKGGVWIAYGDRYVFQTLDRWSVFSAGATINRMVVDDLILWIATDDGVIRFDIGSQQSTRLGMDEGLPSQRISTVAFDSDFVWFGTNKGLVRYRKTDRSLKVYDESHGLPSKVITSSVTIGRQVWFGTRAGIASYSPDVEALRGFGETDGLAGGDIQELLQIGDDLWCRTDLGLSRFRLQQRVFTNFSLAALKAETLTVVSPDGSDIYLGTDQGLFQFQAAGDSLTPWPQQSALTSKKITGVEVTKEYVFITTDQEIVQFSKITKSIRRFTEAEGLVRQENVVGSVLLGSAYTVLFPDGAAMLNIERDLWTNRSLRTSISETSRTNFRFFGKLDTNLPYDFHRSRPTGWRDGFEPERYANLDGGFGFGHQFQNERTLNASAKLDYGQLESKGILDLQYKVEYLGNPTDVVREVRAEDKLKYRFLEEGLERPLLLQGVHARVASPGTEPKAHLQADVGFRRGQVVRDFMTGPRQNGYPLSHRYIIPGSERVTVDGELLTNGTDYTMLYNVGQLEFLNPERVDDLSVISVEYEYDLVPKKELGTLSLLSMLPGDNEIGTWSKAGEPRLISDTTGLFNKIDGAAPKYIDRNWVRSVYVDYRQGGRGVQVAIHDMGDATNAESLYLFDLPTSRIPIEDRKNAVIDTGLSSAYAAKAQFERFYVEVSIDERSDASLVFVQAFTKAILDRKSQATSNLGDEFKEWMVSARAALTPMHGLEVGARVVELQQMEDARQTRLDANGNPVIDVTPARRLLTGTADARYQRPVGDGGMITTYAELAGSHDQNAGGPDGLASMGFVRLSHPRLEGLLSGRLDSRTWTGLASNDTRFGKLHDEFRLNATGYPVLWLPSTVFFTRQRAYLPDGSGGQGLIQHALARVQLNRTGFPATTLQIGSTELDNPNAFRTSRLQGSAQMDYDWAPLLSFTRIKRFTTRALYSLSQAETQEGGTYAYADRVRLIRMESKFSPTDTESLWALFRSRDLGRQEDEQGPFRRSFYRWEILSGAQSTIVPGIVPKLTYNVSYEDTRLPSATRTSSTLASPVPPLTVTNLGPAYTSLIPPGPGNMALTLPTRSTKGTAGGSFGIYPGQWFPRLSALAFEPSLAIGTDEQAIDDQKTILRRTYDVVGLEVYAGQKLELEIYQRYRFTTTGPDQHQDSSNLLLRKRIVYRPTPFSPVTWRFNYQGDRTRNDPALVGLSAALWAKKTSYETWLEWLMRWSPKLTTRSRLQGNRERTADYVVTDAKSGLTQTFNYIRYTVGGDVEARLFPLEDVSALYLYQRVGILRLFGWHPGSIEAWKGVIVAGVIWRMGDKLYLEGQATYDSLSCLVADGCKAVSRLEPRLLLTMNL